MFKIWSFALFYAFFLPYITFLISVAMICLYLLEKRNVYSHYSQRRYLGVELEIKFLNIYINFFCIYECIIYILNVESEWQKIAAGVSTVLSLLLQIIYWQIIKKKLAKRKEKLLIKVDMASKLKKEDEESKLVNTENGDLESPMMQDEERTNRTVSKEDEDEKMELEGLTTNKSYDEEYTNFLRTFYQPELDAEIKRYLEMLDEINAPALDAEKMPLAASDKNDDEANRRTSQIEMTDAAKPS